MHNKFIKWHLYAGLICFPYFIIFGVSSLNFNHRFSFMQPLSKAIHWQKQINTPPYQDDEQFAGAIRDSLQLMGWTPSWEIKKDSAGFQFMITHPGKDYLINVFNNERVVRVEETHKGFWNIFNSLHGFNEKIPGSTAFLNSWGIYSNVAVFVMLFSIISGVYIFLKNKKERKTGFIILLGCLGFSLLLMLLAWL